MDDLLTPPPIREEHEAMSAKLSGIVAEGKETMPEVIAPLVCKPLELEPWRVFKIMSEFVTGFELIQKYSTAASFFGSERAQPDNPAYQAATELAARLARYGFAIITGVHRASWKPRTRALMTQAEHHLASTSGFNRTSRPTRIRLSRCSSIISSCGK